MLRRYGDIVVTMTTTKQWPAELFGVPALSHTTKGTKMNSALTPTREVNSYRVSDLTNSRVLGYVNSVSELGAKQQAARRADLNFGVHVGVTLADPIEAIRAKLSQETRDLFGFEPEPVTPVAYSAIDTLVIESDRDLNEDPTGYVWDELNPAFIVARRNAARAAYDDAAIHFDTVCRKLDKVQTEADMTFDILGYVPEPLARAVRNMNAAYDAASDILRDAARELDAD